VTAQTIVRVNLETLTVRKEVIESRGLPLGGRSLTSYIVSKEAPPSVHPLSPENILVISPSLLAGTSAPNVNRLSIGAKSPLTGLIKESNLGGTVPFHLAKLGIAALVLERQPRKGWFYLYVNPRGVEILPAEQYLGLWNYELVKRLQRNYGPKVGIISIGPAGEQVLSAATIAGTNLEGRPSRHAGRGGLGAVMGSKRVKAIVVDSQGMDTITYVDWEAFQRSAKTFAQKLVEKSLNTTKYGNLVLVNIINAVGGLPTYNFRQGSNDFAEKLSGEYAADILPGRGGRMGHACSPGCVIRCSNIFHDAKGRYITSGLEYETVAMLGSNLGIKSLDEVAPLDRACDEIGLDTIEMGNALAVLAEAGKLEFGDSRAALALIKEVGKGTSLGRILGSGAAVTAKVFGVSRVAVCKGQGLPAYDPRALKGNGVTYATSPMGADHTAGNCLPGRGKPDPHSPEGQVEHSRDNQVRAATLDSTICLYVGHSALKEVASLLEARYGLPVNEQDLLCLGRETLQRELAFNKLAGAPRVNDLPKFFRDEELPPYNLRFDIPLDALQSLFD